MSWKGMFIGSCLGSLFGGPIGSIFGAIIGHQVEKHLAGGGKQPAGNRQAGKSTYSGLSSGKRSMIFCASAAAMLAKMAKADGCVTRDEIAAVETAFGRLGFKAVTRDYAVNVFRKAKDDAHTIYEYAEEFAAAVDSVEIREMLYEILWDVACADGEVSEAELLLLQRVPRSLHIRTEWYGYFFNARLGSSRRGGGAGSGDSLAEAYRVLGATPKDSAETLKRKYRELAKRNHPDALRAQGLPEEMAGKATERMGRINAAWAEVRAARGI